MNAQRPSEVKHSQFSLPADSSFQDPVLSHSHRSTYLFTNNRMSGNGAASGEGSTGTQPRPQSRGTPMERELARSNGLTGAGKRDLQ
jgi:hypothetical protein